LNHDDTVKLSLVLSSETLPSNEGAALVETTQFVFRVQKFREE